MAITAKQGIPQVFFISGSEGRDPSDVLEQALSASQYTAAGAIAEKQGVVCLKAGAAAAMTLAAPTAGNPAAGGDDGKRLLILAEDAFAYTVTTPAGAINGTLHIATWTAGAGNSIELVAFGGVWYATNLTGVALT
ncbi:MAG TPA: hypothetical protein VKV05_12095 [Terriglobales bacterium]|nr:hypothetical protein [Terriglobales bacterium]